MEPVEPSGREGFLLQVRGTIIKPALRKRKSVCQKKPVGGDSGFFVYLTCYNFVMLNNNPDWDKIFNKEDRCELCGDTKFLCDCGDLPDYDNPRDEDEDEFY